MSISDDVALTRQGAWARRHSLSFDGGGVRGYSSLLILQKLIAKIKDIEVKHSESATSSYHPELYNKPFNSSRNSGNGNIVSSHQAREDTHRYLPCHYFDFIAGTSTGGLIAIMLARLRMPVDDAIEVFEDLSKEVFSGSRAPVWLPWIYTYNHRKLERVVKKIVDKRIPTIDPNWSKREKEFFTELTGICNCIVVANGKTKQAHTPYIFRSYISPQTTGDRKRTAGYIRNPGVRDHYPIWQVARATSAAPGYLREMHIEGRDFIDGAIGFNNPTEELYDEVEYLYGAKANSLILSIGTGLHEPRSFGGPIGVVADAL
ncbi:hypothetical protein Egran_06148, partial [Elaphomyces granulatus]